MAEKEDDKDEVNVDAAALKTAQLKKKKKKMLFLIIAIIALAGIGFALYEFGILFPANKEETTGKKGKKKKTAEGEAAHGTTGSSVKSVKQNLNEWVPGVVPGHENDDVMYYNLQEFLVNLNTGGKQTSFIKMKVTLEVSSDGDIEAIDSRMPRITDSFNTYLRELRTSDIAGSAGLYRLREELLLRVNKTIYPNKVNDILFREVIIQ